MTYLIPRLSGTYLDYLDRPENATVARTSAVNNYRSAFYTWFTAATADRPEFGWYRTFNTGAANESPGRGVAFLDFTGGVLSASDYPFMDMIVNDTIVFGTPAWQAYQFLSTRERVAYKFSYDEMTKVTTPLKAAHATFMNAVKAYTYYDYVWNALQALTPIATIPLPANPTWADARAARDALDAAISNYTAIVNAGPAASKTPAYPIPSDMNARATALYTSRAAALDALIAQLDTRQAMLALQNAQIKFETDAASANVIIAELRTYSLASPETKIQTQIESLLAARSLMVSDIAAIRALSQSHYDTNLSVYTAALATVDTAVSAARTLLDQIAAQRDGAVSQAADDYFASVSKDLQDWTLARDEVYRFRFQVNDLLAKLAITTATYSRANTAAQYDANLTRFGQQKQALDAGLAWAQTTITALDAAIAKAQAIVTARDLSTPRPVAPVIAPRPAVPTAITDPLVVPILGVSPAGNTGVAPLLTGAYALPVSSPISVTPTVVSAKSVSQSTPKSNPFGWMVAATVLFNLFS